MTTLAETIAGTDVRPGTVMAWWLSGTGFVLKTPAGTQLYMEAPISATAWRRSSASTAQCRRRCRWSWPAGSGHHAPLARGPSRSEALPNWRNAARPFLCPPTCRSRLLGWGVPDARITAISASGSHTFARRAGDGHGAGPPPRGNSRLGGARRHRRTHRRGRRAAHLPHGRPRSTTCACALWPTTPRRPIDVMMTVINGTGGNMGAHKRPSSRGNWVPTP
ncbi:MAG: hypothetical protein R2838_14305 [Caldilineaceae bacterium]